MTESDSPSIQSHKHGSVVHVTLNEPASLNALTPAMVDTLHHKFMSWRDDASIRWIVMEGTGGKAFCAGADVRAMWHHASAGEYESIERYFSRKYDVDLLLAQYPKPVIALVDGICFGGGMGLAVHSTHCVATEAASFSMPETLIGFFPDAGATWFLSQIPGAVGLYLGLTGARVAGPDAVRLGWLVITFHASISPRFPLNFWNTDPRSSRASTSGCRPRRSKKSGRRSTDVLALKA